MKRQERELIRWIRQHSPPSSRVTLGIGDDTAELSFPAEGNCLVTSDMLMEGTHFTFPAATPAEVGHKALAVNLSDIAAMAGKPLAAVISLACSRNAPEDFEQEFYRGLFALADQFDVAVIGGDTNAWDGPFVVSITLMGEPTGRGAVTRAGAQPGDWIFVTGPLGGSLSGHHLRFPPRVKEAQLLHAAVALHSMIDLSDGLAADLYHLLDESNAGAVIDRENVPVNSQVGGDDQTRLQHALSDGEDFELLFTVSPEDGQRLVEHSPLAIPLTKIGEMVVGNECHLRRGKEELELLPRGGYQHAW